MDPRGQTEVKPLEQYVDHPFTRRSDPSEALTRRSAASSLCSLTSLVDLPFRAQAFTMAGKISKAQQVKKSREAKRKGTAQEVIEDDKD